MGDAVIGWNVSASPNGGMLAVGTNHGAVNVVDGRTPRIARHIRANRKWGSNGTFDRDGRTLAIAADEFFGFWDARTGELLHRTRVGRTTSWGPRTSADGRCVALSGTDHQIRIWDARNFKQVNSGEFTATGVGSRRPSNYATVRDGPRRP